MCERKANWPPWSLVRHACLELRQLMPAGRPCQVGAGLLLFASTFDHSVRPCCVVGELCFFLSFLGGLFFSLQMESPFFLCE